ncbi:MAG: Hsp20/alpha crystallin family protein [Actinomycetota bacterium]
MAIVKWTPWTDLDAMERRLRRFFDETGFVPAPVPAADVYELEDDFVVELEVPGYEQKDLEIELTDHTLVVTGELKTAKEEQEKAFRLHERLEKSFERRFAVPPEVDLEQFHADFSKGVLKVTAPKLKGMEPKKIAIGSRA